EARVAPRVVAQVVAGVGDAPCLRGGLSGALSDEEEGGAHTLAGQHVEDARRPLGVRPVVEGEADRAALARAAPDRPQGEQVRAPRVGAPEPGRRARHQPAGPLHDEGRLATRRVSRPLCTTSSRWLRIERSSMTTPPSFIERLATVVETLRMVSPTRVGLRKRHSNPMNASTTSGGCGTPQPRPEDMQRGMRSGIAPGSDGVRVSEPKSVAWVSVRVMPGVSRGTLVCTSSK